MPVLTEEKTERKLDCPVKIISVARFAEQKDHETLILALEKCRDLDWTLELVGKGETFEPLKSLVNTLGLNERIFFLGERDDIDRLLNKSDIFTLISNWEGFPISILEAMRAGLPVIASDVGGVRESVIDGQTGFLVTRKDIDQLAEKFSILIKNGVFRKEMGGRGESKFLEDFSFEKMYEKTFEQYQLACEK